MSFAKVHSAQTSMLDAHIIDIEIDIARGLHAFSIVGLPDKAVEEARDRFAAALKNSGFDSPKSKNEKLVVALAPADLKKEGSHFDLGIAIAYLLATDDISFQPTQKLFLGELSLDGTLRPLRGVLPLVVQARARGFTDIFVPHANAREAALVDNVTIYGATTLRDVIDHLHTPSSDEPRGVSLTPQIQTEITPNPPSFHIDMQDIRGQETAKRGLEIAAAGRHNVAMYGPPGTGKTMLAKAFATLLPQLSFNEILEVTGIHSIAGALGDDLITHPPFRSPHHSASHVALVGGGALPRPGEVTLAHRGVLFLDEFPEFDRRVIEALRQPLEDGVVSISRARGTAQFPANIILVAALNPCPCGNFGSDKICTCPPNRLHAYQKKISGPIVDRIDLWLEVGQIAHDALSTPDPNAESSAAVCKRITAARHLQEERFDTQPHIITNSDMGVTELDTLIDLDDDVTALLNTSAHKLDLSARSYHKMIKLARTIADLDGMSNITTAHILEALQYRPKAAIL